MIETASIDPSGFSIVVTAGVSALLSGALSAAITIANVSRRFGEMTQTLTSVERSITQQDALMREHDRQLAEMRGALNAGTRYRNSSGLRNNPGNQG
jgi:hypothetical protein